MQPYTTSSNYNYEPITDHCSLLVTLMKKQINRSACKTREKHLLKKYIFVKLKVNPLNVKLTKWLNTLKQFVGNLPTNFLSVFGHFVGLALKWLMTYNFTKMSLIGIFEGILLVQINYPSRHRG